LLITPQLQESALQEIVAAFNQYQVGSQATLTLQISFATLQLPNAGITISLPSNFVRRGTGHTVTGLWTVNGVPATTTPQAFSDVLYTYDSTNTYILSIAIAMFAGGQILQPFD
jgi:hypothetical protein